MPITYGPRDKVLARIESDPELNRPFGAILPYMTFEMKYLYYDADRHFNKLGKEVGIVSTNKNVAATTFNPVPYTFIFELNVIVKNAEDGTKILEQILPFFAPDWTAKLQIIDEPAIIKDIPISFISHDSIDEWKGDYSQRRYLQHTIRFEMKGWLFGPNVRQKIIKKFEGNFTTTDGAVDATVTVVPGLTANGTTTNSAIDSVDYDYISWDDDYGFIVDTIVTP